MYRVFPVMAQITQYYMCHDTNYSMYIKHMDFVHKWNSHEMPCLPLFMQLPLEIMHLFMKGNHSMYYIYTCKRELMIAPTHQILLYFIYKLHGLCAQVEFPWNAMITSFMKLPLEVIYLFKKENHSMYYIYTCIRDPMIAPTHQIVL